ncbi:DUF6998 domain-containing protein [Rhizobium sp. GCM10022189]|uniref:DUF6998 domain-containing protein n=1 Tax=Rhizobium sp. GCM10022189 TaxID=3252654 RepID=UPI00361E21BE
MVEPVHPFQGGEFNCALADGWRNLRVRQRRPHRGYRYRPFAFSADAGDLTLDGNLIGDISEAVAVELFGLALSTRNGTGIDGGHAPNCRTVQVRQGSDLAHDELVDAA